MLVTIVVPSYNRRPHLAQCLASISAQTYGEWQCIVCDDGSTDGTHEYVRELALRDSRVRLSLGERHGLPAGPRNRGIAEARGEWVAFVDDDDLWHPCKLERQLAAAARSALDAVATGLVMFDEGRAPEWMEHDPASPVDELRLDAILRLESPFPSTPTNMIRRDRLTSVGGFAEHPAYRALEDYDLWCRLQQLPGFRWGMIGGPPLAAARQAGEDSISSWRKVPAPDFVRQRWAMLEIFARTYAANRPALHASGRALGESLIELTDGCAHRSHLLGWRRTAITAYRMAASLAWRAGDRRGAALRLARAVRFGALGRAAEPAPMPEAVSLLRDRGERYVRAILREATMRGDPLSILPDGRWSSLQRPSGETTPALGAA